MNLAKVALYLEYIAFRLRYEYAPQTLGDIMSRPSPVHAVSPIENDKPAEDKKAKGTLVADPELVAMNKIAKLMAAIAPDERCRIATWFQAKYRPYLEPSRTETPDARD
jgi:hypothetical protein